MQCWCAALTCIHGQFSAANRFRCGDNRLVLGYINNYIVFRIARRHFSCAVVQCSPDSLVAPIGQRW